MVIKMVKEFKIWTKYDGEGEEPKLYYYPAKEKKTKATVLIFPGGAYTHLAEHEGKGYAEFLNSIGMDAFVLKYRLHPNRFPSYLLDARRALGFIKRNSKKFDIDKKKILVMGSSAGGNLATLLATCDLEFPEIKREFSKYDDDYALAGQILCYPYIGIGQDYKIQWAEDIMFGENIPHNIDFNTIDPICNVKDRTPMAFFFHTFDDTVVTVKNTFDYANVLKENGKSAEIHIFPYGNHGLGLGTSKGRKNAHVAQWGKLLENWLKVNKFLK